MSEDRRLTPTDPRFILNTKTNSAYYVSAAFKRLSRVGVVRRVGYKTDKELYDFFEKNKVELNRRFPIGNELSLGGMTGATEA